MSEQEKKELVKEMAGLVVAEMQMYQKETLTFEEAARYTGLTKSYLYKLTMKNTIPYYKPNGKMCYFSRLELDQWMQSNRIATVQEIADEANRRTMKSAR